MAVQSLGWGPGVGWKGAGGHRTGRGPSSSLSGPGPITFLGAEQLEGEAVRRNSGPLPTFSPPAPKHGSVHPASLHPSYPEAGPPEPPGAGRARAPWLEAKAAWEWGGGQQLVLESPQAGAGAGHRGGQTTPCPSGAPGLLVALPPCTEGHEDRRVLKGPQGAWAGVPGSRGATQLRLGIREGFLEERVTR